MRSYLFFFPGILLGLYISWPGILIPKDWKCFNDIIVKSSEDKISFKAIMEVSPSYLINGNPLPGKQNKEDFVVFINKTL